MVTAADMTTTHILNHPAASIMLVLDEESGQFDLHPCSLPPSQEQLPASPNGRKLVFQAQALFRADVAIKTRNWGVQAREMASQHETQTGRPILTGFHSANTSDWESNGENG